MGRLRKVGQAALRTDPEAARHTGPVGVPEEAHRTVPAEELHSPAAAEGTGPEED